MVSVYVTTTQAMLDRDADSDDEEEDALICVSFDGTTQGPLHFRFVRALPHLLLFDAAFVSTLGDNNNHSFCPCGRSGSAWRHYFGFLTEDLAGGCMEEDTEHLTKGYRGTSSWKTCCSMNSMIRTPGKPPKCCFFSIPYY